MKQVKTSLGVWTVAVFTGACAWGWNSISVPGDAFSAGWDVNANNLPTHSGSVWSGDLAVKGAGDFKFAANHSWDANWGDSLTIERLPAYGVGPLYDHGGNIHLAVDKAQTIHFAFDENALTCDLTGVAAPAVTSAKLIGDFNQDGSLDAGELSPSGANLWTADLTLTTGDNLRLQVNGGEWWGAIRTVSAELPASLSMCGSAAVSIDDFHSGTFRVTFDASTLMLSIAQTATNQFVAAGIAADSDNLATLKRQDVNLVRESANLYSGNFWWNGGDFTLSFGQRDANGASGGTYWSAASSSVVTLSAGVTTETFTPVMRASDVVRRTYRASVAGMYRITFNPNTGVATLQRTYTAASGINLVADPSLENGSGWNFFNAERAYSTDPSQNAALHTGSGAGVLLPLQRHADDANYGSISTAIDVSSEIGSTLKISAWLRRLGEWNASRTRLWIEWKDADWKTIAEKDMTIYDLSPFWQKYSLEAEIPEGADKANILFSFQEAKEGDGFVYVDDVEVRLASGRALNFDAWTPVESATFGNYSPDWRGTGIRTTNNASDAFVESGSVFFSRYVEGSSNNKALELFNPTAQPVDLSGWTIEQYDNGASSPSSTFALSGTIATGACFLITRPFDGIYGNLTPVAAELQAASDLQFPALTFNGDDVLVLRDPSGAIMDRIGEVRANITGSLLNYVLKDHTLVRAAVTAHGTTNGLSETFPYAEWEVLPCDDFDGLKSHVRAIPSDVYIPSGLSLVFGAQGRLESPPEPLDGGIGDVSFWYRTAFPETEGRTGSATLVIEGATDAAFAGAVEIATLEIPATQYAFSNFSLRLDLPELSYFRIRATNVTDRSFPRIDDLSVTAPLPISRYQDFGLWTNANWIAYVGNYSLAGWSLNAGKISAGGGLSGSPAAVLPPGASVVSPAIEGGIGEIRFATRSDPDDEDSSAYALTVEQSTDGGATWTALGTATNSGAAWVDNTFTSGETGPTAVRFTSAGAGGLLLENIELRIPEGDSRNQNFDSWVQNSYGSSRHQGWLMSSGLTAADAAKDGARGLRMKTGGAFVQSARLDGGIGTLSFWARPSSASAKPGFQVGYSTDGGTNWTMLATNRLDGSSSTEWTEFTVQFDREDITHVRILNKLSQAVCIDSIVCGKIPVPPAIDIIPFANPNAPYPGDSFKLGAYVHPVGSATASDILSATVDYTIRKGARVLEQGTVPLAYSSEQGAWISESFPGQGDGVTVHYTVNVTWLCNGEETVSSSDGASIYISEIANGGVWINEIVYAALDDYDSSGGSGGGEEDCDYWSILEGTCTNGSGSFVTLEGHEYVEICGPARTNLTGWKLEFQFLRPADIAANNGEATYATYTFTAANTTPASALVLSDTADGYGFFVVGDRCDEWNVQVPLTIEVPAGFSAGAGDNIYMGPGIVNLKNAQNVIIDSISYGASVAGSTAMGNQDLASHSLGAMGGPGYNGDSFIRDQAQQQVLGLDPLDPSPGLANAGQTFQDRPSSARTTPYAFHDAAREIIPDLADTAPFHMLNPEGATVNDNVELVLGYPASYGDHADCSILVRLRGEDTYHVLYPPAGLRENSRSGTNIFSSGFLGEGAYTRLDTIEYYFVFNPDDANYNDAFIALGEDGDSCVYEDENEAMKHPFAYTFPFHDQIEFLSFLVTLEPVPLAEAVFYTPDYDTPPDISEVGLEGNLDSQLDTNAWFKVDLDSITAEKVNTGSDDEKGTYYTVTFEPPGAPLFIRVAPTRLDAPAEAP